MCRRLLAVIADALAAMCPYRRQTRYRAEARRREGLYAKDRKAAATSAGAGMVAMVTSPGISTRAALAVARRPALAKLSALWGSAGVGNTRLCGTGRGRRPAPPSATALAASGPLATVTSSPCAAKAWARGISGVMWPVWGTQLTTTRTGASRGTLNWARANGATTTERVAMTQPTNVYLANLSGP